MTEVEPVRGHKIALQHGELEQIDARRRLSVQAIHEIIRREGAHELERPLPALAWSGLAAGLTMGFSMVVVGVLEASLPPAPWRHLVTKLGYAVGFVIVILGRQQLFTENTLTPFLPLLHRRDRATLVRMLRLWGVVFAANLVGAVAFALAAAHTGAFDAEVKQAFGGLGTAALEGGFGLVLVRGIFAGWLIALLVWILPGAESGRVVLITGITYIIGIAGLSHVVAGTVPVAFAASRGLVGWGDVALGFVLPALLGNVIGGVTLVAALGHAQVAADAQGRHAREPEGAVET